MKLSSSKDNSRRRFRGGGPRPDRNETKRREASERAAARALLGPTEQLQVIASRRGKSRREARRLAGMVRP